MTQMLKIRFCHIDPKLSPINIHNNNIHLLRMQRLPTTSFKERMYIRRELNKEQDLQ